MRQFSDRTFTFNVNESIILPSKEIEKEYILDHWEDDDGHKYVPGKAIRLSGNTSFKAIWKRDPEYYHIVLHSDYESENKYRTRTFIKSGTLIELPKLTSLRVR